MSCFSRSGRHREPDGGPLVRPFGPRLDLPAVPLHDALAGGQPDPAAWVLVPVLLPGVLPRLDPEVEDLLARVLDLREALPPQPLDPDPVVGNADDPVRPLPAG